MDCLVAKTVQPLDLANSNQRRSRMKGNEMTTQEQAKAMLPFITAMAEGKVVEYRREGSGFWLLLPEDFLFYVTAHNTDRLRIRPDMVKVPLRRDDIDIRNDLFRDFVHPDNWYTATGIDSTAVWFIGLWFTWDQLRANYERSVDGGKTWSRCEKEAKE
jgi:hypothetical protein